MSEKASALFSVYVIDGVQRELTPARLLDAVSEAGVICTCADGNPPVVVDETIDAVGGVADCDSRDPLAFLPELAACMDIVPVAHAAEFTRVALASSVIDALWQVGRFGLCDLDVAASWSVCGAAVGNMAAFYFSVESAAEYIDSLGLRFVSCACGAADRIAMKFKAVPAPRPSGGDVFALEPFKAHDAYMEDARICPSALVPDPRSWVVYIPFDTADFLPGGSAFAQAAGIASAAPRIEDADYFMDCFEVLREFAEDGVLLSGATVGRGGLVKAVSDMCVSSGCGMELDVSGIMCAYREKSMARVLYSEIPGAVIQIRDADFDYMDAELLLQDVAYYPLGHPVAGGRLAVAAPGTSGIETILESLMRNAEGED